MRRARRRLLLAALAGVALLLSAELAGADAPSGTAAGFATPTAAAQPAGIVAGPDGDMWFAETAPGGHFHIGTITTSGTVTEFPLMSDPPTGAITSVAGALWFPDDFNGEGQVDEMTTAGVKTTPITHLNPSLEGIAADAAGDLWLTSPLGRGIYEIKAPYTTASLIPLHGSNPDWITAAPDGKTMWFTDAHNDQIDSIAPTTPVPTVTLHDLPSGVSGTLGEIVLGPDGNLYAGLAGSPSYVLQITPAGVITPFALPPQSTANPDVLAVGADKLIWIEGGGMLTSMSTTGVFTDYAGVLPATDAFAGIAADPAADALWLTDRTASTIYRVALSPPPPPPPPPPPTTTATTPVGPVLPPPLTAALDPVGGVGKTSVTLSGTLGEPAGSAATSVTYQFEYGITTAYGQTTASASTIVTPAGTTVSVPLTGLAAYTSYHYRLVASDCSAATCEVQSPDESFTTGSTLSPQPGVDVGAAPISGTVRVKLPGRGYTTLTAGELIPLGATLDTTHGTVLVESATGPGEVASGQFSRGVFSLAQPKGVTATTLKLSSNYSRCPKVVPHKGPLAHVAAAKPKGGSKGSSKPTPKPGKKASTKVVNQVFGNAHGQFKTRGHYATAADEGTGWRTTDRCDGTLITVTAGKVVVTDRVRHRTVVVTAGHHYLARRRG